MHTREDTPHVPAATAAAAAAVEGERSTAAAAATCGDRGDDFPTYLYEDGRTHTMHVRIKHDAGPCRSAGCDVRDWAQHHAHGQCGAPSACAQTANAALVPRSSASDVIWAAASAALSIPSAVVTTPAVAAAAAATGWSSLSSSTSV